MAYFLDKNAIEQQVDDNSFRSVMVHDGKMMMVRVRFVNAAGETGIAPHSHPHEQVCYIVKGSFRFLVDGEERVVRAGDTCHFPPNVPHGCVPLESDSVVLDVFTPIREDFLA